MAKPKSANGVTKIPNKSLHSRVSYLYQAATYFATQQRHSTVREPQKANTKTQTDQTSAPREDGAARLMVSELRAVTLKMQMRISPAIKNSICKSCDTMLIDGSTCTSTVENKSKGGKKSWSDILVRKCNVCGVAKRFPLSAERQKRRPHRDKEEQQEKEVMAAS